jgi:lipoprotein-anchoring transpeptidase ErfK/SrfK
MDYRQIGQWPVAVGMDKIESGGLSGLETPFGLYKVTVRDKRPKWIAPHSKWVPEEIQGKVFKYGDPENPIRGHALWLEQGVGIHGIPPEEDYTIGTDASHGCIRMTIADINDLFGRVPRKTPVYVV